jgi:hypothetical protein
LQPFGAEVGTEHGVAGDVSARSGKALNQADPHRIADTDHDDGDGCRRLLGRLCRLRAVGRNQVHRAANELGRDRREPVWCPLTVAVFIRDVLAFDVS